MIKSCPYTNPDLFCQIRCSRLDALWEDVPIHYPAFRPTKTFTDTLTSDVVQCYIGMGDPFRPELQEIVLEELQGNGLRQSTTTVFFLSTSLAPAIEDVATISQ